MSERGYGRWLNNKQVGEVIFDVSVDIGAIASSCRPTSFV